MNRKLKKKRKRLQPIVDDYEFSFVALAEEEVSHGSGLAILDDLKPVLFRHSFVLLICEKLLYVPWFMSTMCDAVRYFLILWYNYFYCNIYLIFKIYKICLI